MTNEVVERRTGHYKALLIILYLLLLAINLVEPLLNWNININKPITNAFCQKQIYFLL